MIYARRAPYEGVAAFFRLRNPRPPRAERWAVRGLGGLPNEHCPKGALFGRRGGATVDDGGMLRTRPAPVRVMQWWLMLAPVVFFGQ